MFLCPVIAGQDTAWASGAANVQGSWANSEKETGNRIHADSSSISGSSAHRPAGAGGGTGGGPWSWKKTEWGRVRRANEYSLGLDWAQLPPESSLNDLALKMYLPKKQ